MFSENHFAFSVITNFLKKLNLLSEFDSNNINILPLKGGKSNATLYKFDVSLSSYVLRFPPSTTNPLNKILQVFLAKQAGIIGIGPKVQFIDPEQHAIIMDYIPGRNASPLDFMDDASITNFSKLLQKLHRSPLDFPVAISPFNRFRSFLLKCDQKKLNLPLNFSEIKLIMQKSEEILQLHPVTLTPTHLDLNLSNIIIFNNQFSLVDWVNGGLSDPYFDLATFSIFAGFDENRTRKFLTHYFQKTPTALEWARFVIIRPVRLFVIAVSCFSTSSKEDIQKYDDAEHINSKPLLFDEFIHTNEETQQYSHWQIGLAAFMKGLELIHDDSFKDSFNFLQDYISHKILEL